MEEKKYVGELIIIKGNDQNEMKILGKTILRCISTDDPDVINIDDQIKDVPIYDLKSTQIVEFKNDCQVRCANKMKNEFTKIVVTVTFESEIESYINIAERYNYKTYIISLDEVK